LCEGKIKEIKEETKKRKEVEKSFEDSKIKVKYILPFMSLCDL